MVDSEDTSEVRAILQRDLDRLEEWASKNCVKLKKEKCKVLHLGWANQRAQYRLGSVWLGSSLNEKDMAVLADKMNKSQQHITAATKANQILDCTFRVIIRKERVVITPLHSALIKSHLERYV